MGNSAKMGNSCTTETMSEMDDSSLSDSTINSDIEEHTFQSTEEFHGWLEKKSKHLGSWRKRWTVVTDNGCGTELSTFKEDPNLSPKSKATEKILINRSIVVSTNDSDDTVFTIYHKASEASFLFRAPSVQQRDEWMSYLQNHSEFEDNDQYSVNIIDDTEAVLRVMHVPTKQSWSAPIENESQREYFQDSEAKYQLKLDEQSGTMSIYLEHSGQHDVSMVLSMDFLSGTRSSKNLLIEDDDDYKNPVTDVIPDVIPEVIPEPVPELTEEQKKNLESYNHYTFEFLPVEDDHVQVQLSHVPSNMDFTVTVGFDSIGPLCPALEVPAEIKPHSEEDIVEVVDGADVNKLFGNDESSDDEEEIVAVNSVKIEPESQPQTVKLLTPPRPPTMMECLLERKKSCAIQLTVQKTGKETYIELTFDLNGVTRTVHAMQTPESLSRLVQLENAASYTLYQLEMSIKFEESQETPSLRIDIKHLESGRDFEVTLADAWLQAHYPQKYKIVAVPVQSGPPPAPVQLPVKNMVPAPIPTGFNPISKAPAPVPIGGATVLKPMLVISNSEDVKVASKTVVAIDNVLEFVAADTEMTEAKEPEKVTELNELQVLMETIELCKDQFTLQMTMNEAFRKQSIELKFKMDNQPHVICVPRTADCIQREIEMEQKEEKELESRYIDGIKGVSDTGYGQYCAIEGLVDRHTFKSHKNDNPDPQSVNSRKIMRELRKTLAKGVYLSYANGSMFVRFDESNPRFLQAMLVGLQGTPYFNGCFLFDIYLPDEYPVKPCKVKHVSNGSQLCHANNGPGGFSPNLHQSSGKVCLSLLGTWSGPGWEPNKSNVYQLLSTLLLMVFGAEHPYYMEPSYGGWEGTAYSIKKHDKKVIQYDEEVLYHTAKSTMLEIIRKPYPGFEDIIKTHFKLKSMQIRNHMEEILNSETYSASFKKKITPIYESIRQELDKM